MAEEYTLTIEEVCKRLNISRSMVYKLRAMGDFPAPAKIGKKSIWKKDSIDKWFDSKENIMN